MNQILANIQHVFSNLHVSVPIAVAVTLAVLPIWFPHYTDQLRATAAVLSGYGVIAAANTPTTTQNPPKS